MEAGACLPHGDDLVDPRLPLEEKAQEAETLRGLRAFRPGCTGKTALCKQSNGLAEASKSTIAACCVKFTFIFTVET